jgi:hypothetical protein
MKKELILLSFVSSMLLADTFINPLPNSVKATDNGGTKSAIDAYKDGIGAELMDKPGIATDNAAMNTLVFKYGEAAKTANQSIVDKVNGTAGVSTADLALAAQISANNQNGISELSSITDLNSIPITSKAIFTFNGGVDSFGGSASELFDKNIIANGSTAGSVLFQPNANYVDITVNSNFRIWTYIDYTGWLSYNSSLKIVEATTGLTILNTLKGTLRSISIVKWNLATGTIPAGRYRIYAESDGTLSARIDSEWFIEKVN